MYFSKPSISQILIIKTIFSSLILSWIHNQHSLNRCYFGIIGGTASDEKISKRPAYHKQKGLEGQQLITVLSEEKGFTGI